MVSCRFTKSINYQVVCRILIGMFLCISCAIAWFCKPTIDADAGEYILHVEAILNHQSLDIREDDLESALKSYDEKYHADIVSRYNSFTLLQADDGKSYFVHYGGYSAFVVPMKVLLDVLGKDPLRAFTITNLALWLGALLIVYKCLKVVWKKKALLLALLIFSPALLYTFWIHAEIFIYAFVIVALVFFYNGSHRKSILAMSMAGMQMPALIPFAALIGVDYAIQLCKQAKGGERVCRHARQASRAQVIRTIAIKLLLAGLCYIPILLPILLAYTNFHVLSLAATLASEYAYMGEKAFALYMDPNIGILPYEPFMLVLFVVFLVRGFIVQRYFAVLNFLALAGCTFIIASGLQINCGMNGIMRYNIWILPIMQFYIVMNIDKFFDRKWITNVSYIGAVATPFYLSAILIITGIYPYSYRYQEFAPWVLPVLNNVPQLYNPTHGIFMTRAIQSERYATESPTIYYDDRGFAKKILVDDKTVGLLDSYFIQGSDQDVELVKTLIEAASEGTGYRYIDIGAQADVKVYRPMDSFYATALWDVTGTQGVYPFQNDYCWVRENCSFALNEDAIGSRDVRMNYIPQRDIYGDNADKDLTIELYCNSRLLETIKVDQWDDVDELIIDNEELPDAVQGLYIFELKSNNSVEYYQDGTTFDYGDISYKLLYMGANAE